MTSLRFTWSPVRQKTDAEIAEARAKAARDLTNIDDEERKRRVIFGSALLVSHPSHAHAVATFEHVK